MTIGVTAERRAAQQAELLESRGATVLLGPTLRVFSESEDEALRATTAELIAHPPDFLIASTGFGMRTWLAAAEAWGQRELLVAALNRGRVGNRGAKAASANTAAGLTEWWRAPHERLDEVVARVAAEPLAGRRVVLQRHGDSDSDAITRLVDAGAEVITVDPYRLSLPVDSNPARHLIRAACAGELAAVTFVSAPAVHNLFALASGIGVDTALRQAFNTRVVAACVGPVCAEGAIDEGVARPLIPSRARLVPMVQTLAEYLQDRLD
jgi:uroporphyrinogen-III synthase